ncbi:hypothetical protein H8959_005280 [Pygathrix nigripes]
MSRSLSWFEQPDVLLNTTDGNVARIKCCGRSGDYAEGIEVAAVPAETSIHVLQSKLPLATTITMSVSSFSLLDSNSSWELLWKPDPQRSTLSILEPGSFQLHAQSLKQEGLFLWGLKMLLNDL